MQISNKEVKDNYVWIVAITAVLMVIGIANVPPAYLGGYAVGYELLHVNGLFTFIGLYLIRKKPN